MPIVRFETNIPQTLTLRFAAGKEVEGQFGPQFYHQLANGDQVYLAPVVETKLAELGVKDGETVEILKRQNGKRIEWQVTRPGQSGCIPTTPERSTPHQSGPSELSSPQPITTKLGMDRAMSMFLVMAGRSTREAEQILGAEGGSVRFDSRDVCALATTLMIQSFREGWVGWIAPETAQQYVAQIKISGLQPKPAATEIAAKQCNFPAPEQAWKTRGEMKDVFSQLRELVGEVEYHKELEIAGVSDASQFHYLNDARACYSRLVAIAERERRAA